MPYVNKTTGERISDQDFRIRASQQIIPTAPTGGSNFLQRLKLGFGGAEAKAEQQRLETQAGLKGKLDVGDIADIAGATLPVIGGIAGAPFGGLAGSAGGAAAGQGVRRIIGGIIGADQPTAIDITKDVALTGIGSYVGGKILGGMFNLVTKNIPNKLVSTIFKQSADDIGREVKTGGKNLVQSEEILREGLRGDARTMMQTSYKTMKALEAQTQAAVAGRSVTINNKAGYIRLISDYLKNLKKQSYGFEPEIAKEGKAIIEGLSKAKGNTIAAELALNARRFIDGIRRTSSFKLDPTLSSKEAAYKKAADVLRHFLAKQITGLEPIMQRYKIHIDAFDDLAKYAAKTENKDLFDLIDVFIMYGIDPTAYLARRGLTSAAFKTNVAQGLYQGGKILGNLPSGVIPTATTRGIKGFLESD